MSVRVSDRKESPFEARDHARRLRAKIDDLCYRKFGYKRPRINLYNVKEGRPKTTMELYDDEQRLDALEEYWLWKITETADYIDQLLRDFMLHISVANSIFPVYIFECDERRKHQNEAIGICFTIKEELQNVLECVEAIDKNTFEMYFDDLQYEIDLLKGWRKSDNAIRSKIQSQQKQKK